MATGDDLQDIPAPEEARARDEPLSVPFIDAVTEAIGKRDEPIVRTLVSDLHEADLGGLIEALDEEHQSALVGLLGTDFDFAALTEIDDGLRLRILDDLAPEQVAEGVRDLDSDDAVYILEDMDESEQQKILALLPVSDRIPLKRSLDFPEESAGRRMSSDFIAVPPFWTVGQTIDHMRESDDLPDEFYEIYVVDPSVKLIGSVQLDRILRTKRPVKITDLVDENLHAIPATDDQEEIAFRFERYNLVAAPVVDENDRLVGVLTVDNIVDVIQEEADEDIKRLGGVGDEELSDAVIRTFRNRFPWLFVNLLTAILASFVIGIFDATIEQRVALAILMPIVASMGGNAGTQTMTVAVRAIATRDLDIHNMSRVIFRETWVGFANGIAFAGIVGAVAWFWFSAADLSYVIALAMIINMISAGLAGILIPIFLDRFRFDPAVASSVFVTTVTDVVGFFAFLGIASLWFQLAT